MRVLASVVAVVVVVAALGLLSLHAETASAAGGSTLNRPEDPAVLTGGDLPTLTGIAPHDIVGFRWDGAWTQIPVQVDQRDTKTFTTVYNGVIT